MTASPPFRTSFEQYALLGLEKQNRFNSLILDQTHELDLDFGRIRFSSMDIPMQVLGTESDNTFTWLWSWAEEHTEVPEQLLEASRRLHSWGDKERIPEFSSPSLDLETADGHAISLIAAQMCNASCYFRDVYEGGSAFVLLFEKAIDNQPSFDRAGLVRQLANLASRYTLNHRNALLWYCKLKKLPFAEHNAILSVELDTRERLITEFDANGLLTTVNGVVFAGEK